MNLTCVQFSHDEKKVHPNGFLILKISVNLKELYRQDMQDGVRFLNQILLDHKCRIKMIIIIMEDGSFSGE